MIFPGNLHFFTGLKILKQTKQASRLVQVHPPAATRYYLSVFLSPCDGQVEPTALLQHNLLPPFVILYVTRLLE